MKILSFELLQQMLDALHNITFLDEDEEEDIEHIQFVVKAIEEVMDNDY